MPFIKNPAVMATVAPGASGIGLDSQSLDALTKSCMYRGLGDDEKKFGERSIPVCRPV